MSDRRTQSGGKWQRFARLLAFAALAWAAGTPAFAGGTHALSVGAVVLSNSKCQFTNGGPSALAFGSIDPSSTTNRTATASVGFRCTGAAGTAVYNATSDDGLYETAVGAPRMRHAVNTTQFLKYTIDLPQSGSVPRNTNQTLTVTATVLVADFQDAIAGTYSDSVVLTIAP